MVVYVVFYGSSYDIHEIDEIFLDKDKANAYVKKMGKPYYVAEYDAIE